MSSFRGFATYLVRANRPESLVWWELREDITTGGSRPTLAIRWAAPVTALQAEDRAALDLEYPGHAVLG
jgi:hypothetical protein